MFVDACDPTEPNMVVSERRPDNIGSIGIAVDEQQTGSL